MSPSPELPGGTTSASSAPSSSIPPHIFTGANDLLRDISEDTPLALTLRVGRKQITITVDAEEPVPFDDAPEKNEFL